jgi:hypothetical protein
MSELFHQRYIPEPNSGCWLWIGTIQYGKEYGVLGNKGKKAHRLSWEIHFGPIPLGMHVLHKCDVPSCVNPDHLFLGTHVVNMQDRQRKGRTKSALGERQHLAKLNRAKVIEIRNSEETLDALAIRFGVNKTTIWQVKTKRTWRHV